MNEDLKISGVQLEKNRPNQLIPIVTVGDQRIYVDHSSEHPTDYQHLAALFDPSDDDRFLSLFCFDTISQFEQTVLKTLRTIPRGSVITYQGLARLCQNPEAARAVGNTMRKNRFPFFFPCHRVVKKDRTIGKFAYGPSRKMRLLKSEGVGFDQKDRVATNFFYQPDMNKNSPKNQ